MATSKAQRTGIWVITIAMTVGTVVGFLVMILGSQESQKQQSAMAKYQAASSEYTKQTEAQQAALDKQAKQLSKKYFAIFNDEKSSRVGTYDSKSVKKTTITTLKKGHGEAIGDTSTYAAYYVGWLPSGKIFDSSLSKSSLKSPLIARPGGVISGWSNVMKGQKIGGIYQLSITANDGYGAAGSGSIPANSPLKFVVMPIETLKTYTQPAVTQEVIDAYSAQQSQ